MTQATTFGVKRTGPETPTDNQTRIDDNFDAALSNHSGSSRPSYAGAGTIWADNSVSGITTYKFFDGTNDRVIYSVDSSGNFTYPAIKHSGDLDLDGNAIQGVSSINGGQFGGFRNKVINGDFDIWQRQVSHSTSGYGSADRWRLELSGATLSMARQSFAAGQVDVPSSPKYYCEVDVLVGNNYTGISQRVEGVAETAGKECTLTFYAKGLKAGTAIGVRVIQGFGTGGSPSSIVSTGVGSLTALDASWQKFQYVFTVPSIAGKVLGTANNDSLFINVEQDGGDVATDAWNMDIAHMSLVIGDASAEDDPFSVRHIAEELALCLRYYEKSLDSDNQISCGNRANGLNYYTGYSFMVPKRAAPAVTLSNVTGANMGSVNVSVADIYGMRVDAAATADDTNGFYMFNYAADAEL